MEGRPLPHLGLHVCRHIGSESPRQSGTEGGYGRRRRRTTEETEICVAVCHLLLCANIRIETLGPMGEEAAAFFADVGQRIATATGEPRSKSFLMQRLSIAVQQGNAACVLGTVPMSTDLYI